MSSALVLAVDETQPANGSDTIIPQSEVALNRKIESLRRLTLNLLREVEALKKPLPLSPQRGIKLYDEVQRFENNLIRRALELTGGNQTRAAQLLGVKITTLNTKINRYHLADEVLPSHQAMNQEREI